MLSKEKITERFYQGKSLLDRRSYTESIKVYNELLPIVEANDGDEDAQISYETGLNNRGVAKCKQALITKDLAMYEDGIRDLLKSVEASGLVEVQEHEQLTAWRNYKFATKEIGNLETGSGDGLKSSEITK